MLMIQKSNQNEKNIPKSTNIVVNVLSVLNNEYRKQKWKLWLVVKVVIYSQTIMIYFISFLNYIMNEWYIIPHHINTEYTLWSIHIVKYIYVVFLSWQFWKVIELASITLYIFCMNFELIYLTIFLIYII